MTGLELSCYQGRLVARGDAQTISQITDLPGVQIFGSLTSTGYISLPAERFSVMALESLASPTVVTQEYRDVRAALMTVPVDDVLSLMSQLDLRVRTTLLPHQLEFAAFAMTRRGVFNASEQGTGKTLAALVTAHLWGARRVLVVCPKSLVQQWTQEYERFIDIPAERRYQTYPLTDGNMTERAHKLRNISAANTLAVVNYDALHGVASAIPVFNPDLVIFDESWRMKSPNTRVGRLCVALGRNVPRALLLTGTPIGNNVADFWAQLTAVDLNFAMSYSEFRGRYCRMVEVRIANEDGSSHREQRVVGVQDPAGLMRRLEPVWYRATKATALNLPPKQYERVRITLPPATRELYRNVARQGEAALGNTLSLTHEYTTLLRLQQLTGGFRPVMEVNDPLDYLADIEASPDELGLSFSELAAQAVRERVVYLEELPCPKIDWLRRWAEDVLKGDPTVRAMVWVRFNHELSRITRALDEVLARPTPTVYPIWGATPTPYLEQVKAAFNSRDPQGPQVLVCQVKKMAYGHNCQACDWNIYFSHTWSYIERAQSEDRSHRLGREHCVRYVDLVAVGTVDVSIANAMDQHSDLAIRLAPDTVGGLAN